MTETRVPYFSNESPLISVAMPIYNAGKYLRPAVLSIVNQSVTNWEMLIIDDGSTDDALSYIADIRDGRIKVIRDGLNKGLAARLNQAIGLAKGVYLARMDQDDISYPERFAKQLSVLQNNPGLDLVSVRAIKISMQNEPLGYLPYSLGHDEIISAPWRGVYMPHPTWMGKVEWFRKHRYSEPAPYLSEDQELLLRSYNTSQFECLPEVLFAYRIKDKTSFYKLFKTRCALLQLQLAKFIRKNLIKFAILAILFFVAKLTKDGFNELFNSKYAPHGKTKISAIEMSRWEQLLASVSLF